MSDVPVARLAAAIQEVVRTHAASAPPPRALPYLGLERASGTPTRLLDALSARGIFRKYELVLDLGAGLGGTARWLASRLGCDVVGTTASLAEAVAGTELTRRARLSAQVHLLAADETALPVHTGRFTHVWIVEALPRLADADALLAEAFRAVRRGGTVAVQDLVRGDLEPPALAGFHFARLAERRAALERAGFVDLEAHDRSADAIERAAQLVAARERLHARLADDPVLARVAAERDALAAGIASGRLRVVQLLARRA
jgi:sarcosine/dimethylglycine N-methyltransferase